MTVRQFLATRRSRRLIAKAHRAMLKAYGPSWSLNANGVVDLLTRPGTFVAVDVETLERVPGHACPRQPSAVPPLFDAYLFHAREYHNTRRAARQTSRKPRGLRVRHDSRVAFWRKRDKTCADALAVGRRFNFHERWRARADVVALLLADYVSTFGGGGVRQCDRPLQGCRRSVAGRAPVEGLP